MANRHSPHNTQSFDNTKPVIIDLVRQNLNNHEVAEVLNQRQLYMSSGASWNAGRIGLFLAKHQINQIASQ